MYSNAEAASVAVNTVLLPASSAASFIAKNCVADAPDIDCTVAISCSNDTYVSIAFDSAYVAVAPAAVTLPAIPDKILVDNALTLCNPDVTFPNVVFQLGEVFAPSFKSSSYVVFDATISPPYLRFLFSLTLSLISQSVLIIISIISSNSFIGIFNK